MPRKSGTQLLNELKQLGHDVRYEEYLCEGHSERNPQYGCKAYINNKLEGMAENEHRRQVAKENAASKAAQSWLLI